MELQDYIAQQIKARPVEATITRKVIRALKAAGKPVTHVFDGGEMVEVRTEQDILTEVFNLDDSYLYTADGSWVRLTGGNEYDMVCDYTTDLEEALKPVDEWIEKNED